MSSSISRARDRDRDRHRRRSSHSRSRSRSRSRSHSPPRPSASASSDRHHSTRDTHDRPPPSGSDSASSSIRYTGDRDDKYRHSADPDVALPRRPTGLPRSSANAHVRESGRERERERSGRDQHGRHARHDDPPGVSGGGDGYYPRYDDGKSRTRGRDQDRPARDDPCRDRDSRDRDRYQRTEYPDSRLSSSRYDPDGDVRASGRRASMDTGRSGGGGDDARMASREYDRQRNRDQPNEALDRDISRVGPRAYDEYRPSGQVGHMGPPSRNRDQDRDRGRDRDQDRDRERGRDDRWARTSTGADEYRGRDDPRHADRGRDEPRHVDHEFAGDHRDSSSSSGRRRDTSARRGAARDDRPVDAPARSTHARDSREMPPPPPASSSSSHARRDTSVDRGRDRNGSSSRRPRQDTELAARRDDRSAHHSRSRSRSHSRSSSRSHRRDIYLPAQPHGSANDHRAPSHSKRRSSPPQPPARDASPPPPKPAEKPTYVPSGTLNLAATTITLASGRQVQLKYSPPSDACAPAPGHWALFICKHDTTLATNALDPPRTKGSAEAKSYWLLGRDPDLADVLVDSPSVSGQQAVVQFRRGGRPYLLDLESTNGTYLNGDQVEPARYVELKSKDVVRFGASMREIMVLDVSSVTAGTAAGEARR